VASSVGWLVWRESKNQYRRPTPSSAASLAYVSEFYQVLESRQRRMTSASSVANLPIYFVTENITEVGYIILCSIVT
jgi:hypothetical protein